FDVSERVWRPQPDGEEKETRGRGKVGERERHPFPPPGKDAAGGGHKEERGSERDRKGVAEEGEAVGGRRRPQEPDASTDGRRLEPANEKPERSQPAESSERIDDGGEPVDALVGPRVHEEEEDGAEEGDPRSAGTEAPVQQGQEHEAGRQV